MLLPDKETVFNCEYCEFTTRSIPNLQNHNKTKHGEVGLPYRCHLCEKSFKQGRLLTAHLRNEHAMKFTERARYQKDHDTQIYKLSTQKVKIR